MIDCSKKEQKEEKEEEDKEEIPLEESQQQQQQQMFSMMVSFDFYFTCFIFYVLFIYTFFFIYPLYLYRENFVVLEKSDEFLSDEYILLRLKCSTEVSLSLKLFSKKK